MSSPRSKFDNRLFSGITSYEAGDFTFSAPQQNTPRDYSDLDDMDTDEVNKTQDDDDAFAIDLIQTYFSSFIKPKLEMLMEKADQPTAKIVLTNIINAKDMAEAKYTTLIAHVYPEDETAKSFLRHYHKIITSSQDDKNDSLIKGLRDIYAGFDTADLKKFIADHIIFMTQKLLNDLQHFNGNNHESAPQADQNQKFSPKL